MPRSATHCTLVLLPLLLALLRPGALAAPLTDPMVITPGADNTTAVTLVVKAVRHSIPGVVAFDTRLYHVDGVPQFPGPTLRVRPGGRLRITLVNELGPDGATANGAANTFHALNTTNIHAHGLHIDPSLTAASHAAAPGGGTHVYDIPIRADHAPGVHWYHANHRGSSALQVMGGLSGAIVVEAPAASPIHPQLLSLPTHLFFVQQLSLVPEKEKSVATQGCGPHLSAPFRELKPYTLDEITAEAGGSMVAEARWNGTDAGNHWLVNGQLRPTIGMRRNNRVLLQTVIASGHSIVEIAIEEHKCTMHAVAFDGVYLHEVPPRRLLVIRGVPGMRVEVVISCYKAGSFAVLQQRGGVAIRLATLEVSDDPVQTPTLPALLYVKRPDYLVMPKYDSWIQREHLHLTQGDRGATCARRIGEGPNCTLATSDTATCNFTSMTGPRGVGDANVGKYDMVANLTDVVEFWVHGDERMVQGLYFHTNHVAVTHFTPHGNKADADPFEDWAAVHDVRDTVPVLNGVMRIKLFVGTFTGEIPVASSFLEHADRGLATSYLAVSLPPTPAPPTPEPSPTPAPSSPDPQTPTPTTVQPPAPQPSTPQPATPSPAVTGAPTTVVPTPPPPVPTTQFQISLSLDISAVTGTVTENLRQTLAATLSVSADRVKIVSYFSASVAVRFSVDTAVVPSAQAVVSAIDVALNNPSSALRMQFMAMPGSVAAVLNCNTVCSVAGTASSAPTSDNQGCTCTCRTGWAGARCETATATPPSVPNSAANGRMIAVPLLLVLALVVSLSL